MSNSPLSVLLETEGTYPHAAGGVSTWCHSLCQHLSDVEFTLFALTGHPPDGVQYDLPPNVQSVHTLPLWGSHEPSVFSRPKIPFSEIYVSRLQTTSTVVEQNFLPAFERLLQGIASPDEVARDEGQSLHHLYQFFQSHDYKRAFQDRSTWEAFDRIILSEAASMTETPNLSDAATCLRWLYHFLLPLDTPLPRTDLTHTTVAGTCGLSSLVAHWEHDTPMLLTDHGVYLRERHLAVSDTDLSFFQKWFLTHLSQYISRLCYLTAEIVAPVCNYNRRWEERLGADPSRIHTIYNGISTDDFTPGPKPDHVPDRPTVVAATNVFPLKDIETMIRSCAVVRRHVPDVQYRVYGSLDIDTAYTARCEALIHSLDLDDHFLLKGVHNKPTALYHEGDVSILSSISEGFPYAVLEAMACGRPVVATDVGGVREAVVDCGILVPPGDAEALGNGVAKLLTDDDKRAEMGRRARERVLDKFRLADAMATYRDAYEQLTPARSVSH